MCVRRGRRFADRHRALINTYLRRAPHLLETSLAPLLSVPRIIEFDNKRVSAHLGTCRRAAVGWVGAPPDSAAARPSALSLPAGGNGRLQLCRARPPSQ